MYWNIYIYIFIYLYDRQKLIPNNRNHKSGPLAVEAVTTRIIKGIYTFWQVYLFLFLNLNLLDMDGSCKDWVKFVKIYWNPHL